MAWVSYTPEKSVRHMVLEDGKTKVEEPSLVSVLDCIITRRMASHGEKRAVSVQSRTELTFVTRQH